MKPSLSFLQDDLNITPADNNRVKVTLVLLSEFLSQFVYLIDSLSGFVQALSRKSQYQSLPQVLLAISRSNRLNRINLQRDQAKFLNAL
jgi:hypothetical protein